jgi:hypothetical protein
MYVVDLRSAQPAGKLLLVVASLAAGWLLPSAAATAERTPSPQGPVDVAAAVQPLVVADWIDQDRRFGTPQPRLAASSPQPPVKTTEDAAGGVDGVKTGAWGFHTASAEQDPWWQVDLGAPTRLDRVVVFNRTDRGTAARTKNLVVLVATEPKGEFREVYRHTGAPFYGVTENKPLVVSLKDKAVTARIVRLQIPGRCSFALDEIEVYPVDAPAKNVALGKPADQKSVGQYSTRKTTNGKAPGAAATAQAPAGGAFTLAHTADVIRRGRQLVERLRPRAAPARWEPPAAELEKVASRLAALEATKEVPEAARRELYLAARSAVRQIAFANPLLQIDKLLFLKRHDSVGVFHMCDQFYGCNAKPGGGLFVLHDPFGRNPRLQNLLENSVVEKGPLAGKRLEPGSFLSPDVAFDGQTIAFAYTEAKAFAKSQGKETYVWGPEYSHHLFRVNADGTGLIQLTAGDADDFDPCFLPNGRIAFITERRGGYLRCGRHCPVYTLFSMKPDGSDIICLSFHETHEWQPSVTNDGMIAYTRWDYVDRDTNIAHHIWTCFPDGRDPRSFHGNYPVRRERRPWMEMDIRAIPGSNKFVAVTGAHHGQAFGALVLIDPRAIDDNAVSQIERLTPEVPFPESEGRPIKQYSVYGTPWPLSEDDYLCVYDPAVVNRGIYWIDRYGNKELVYRDPAISCLSPMPLRSRPMPPLIPSQTTQTADDLARAGGAAPPATIAVTNVYDSDFAWPAGTKITALRVVQVFPKTTAPPNQPRIGVAEQTNARAVLGTVPVEEDGSAYFEAPPGRELYFQALDATGMAVQSMRSGTYLHPGEQLACQGCHEPKHRPPTVVPAASRLALRRPPSRIQPEPDGAHPFSFVRLVQPVLDRNCVACHVEKKAVDLRGVVEGKHGWTRSYTNLAGKYGFYFHVTNGSINTGVHGGSRTTPGQFGARGAPLLKYLDESHYGVKLSPEDRRRLTLWLDSNSEFYGAYENTTAQAKGEIVQPSLN